MAFDITRFKQALSGGGARPSLFEVTLQFPADVGLNLTIANTLTFLCKATSIPTSTVAPIEVPYFGRKVKFAGNRTFPEWTITVINDENFIVRDAFERWLSGINTHETNVRQYNESITGGYQATGTVSQLGKEGGLLRTYQFMNVFPSEVSPIELNWSSENEVEEFTVTLQYDYWRVLGIPGVGPISGNPGPGGGLVNI
jgi:hypothetical protein